MNQSMLMTIGLVIVGQIVYQIGQKSVPAHASPLVVLAAAYFVSGVVCVGLAWMLGAFAATVSWRPAFAWPTWLLSAAIVAIEVGYLMAYRSGWTLGSAFATASTITVVSLALIDWSAQGNTPSTRQLVGLVCTCFALWLLAPVSRSQ